MSSIYYKMFKVPVWVVLKEMGAGRQKNILAWFKSAEALILNWPANSYKETVATYAKKGWREHLAPGVNLPSQLVMMSAVDHVHKTLGPTSQLVFNSPVHRLSRIVDTTEDYARLFNEILQSQPPIVLSQIFQIAERAHKERGRQFLWVTPAPAPINILSILSDKVITIGEGSDCDINIEGIKVKELSEFLEQKFKEII